ncbi:MAG TPA: general secretion pathway protein GspB, partial [Burkholderiaceae bacterium]
PAPHKPRPLAAAPARAAVPRHAGEAAAPLAGTKGASRPTAPATAAAPESRVYTVNELPDDIRRQLPAVAIGGSRYSPSKADRLLIVNGQALHEGDRIAPGLVLEQIKLKAAVLEYKGYRYAVTY